jgi:hypothetical protein
VNFEADHRFKNGILVNFRLYGGTQKKRIEVSNSVMRVDRTPGRASVAEFTKD